MNEKQFGTMPINKLFAKLAVPGLVAMVFSSIGMMIDGIFVGQFIGSNALAAVNLVMPIAMIFIALGDMIAVGAQVKMSINLGEGDEKGASRIFTASLLTTISIGILIAVFSTIFSKDLILFFVKDTVLATLAYDYAKVLILFLPLTMPFFAIDNYLKICGKVEFSMILNIGVAVSNIILDAILIGYLGLGIEWAALATIVGQIVAVVIALVPFAMKKYTLRFTAPKVSLKTMWEIVYNGSSEFFNNISGSLMAVVINGLLLSFGGGTAVAAYAIIMYIDNLLVSMLYGIQDSIQSAISYNLGAKLYDRIFKLFRVSCVVAFGISMVCMGTMLIFPEFLVGIFSSDADVAVRETAKTALYLFAPSYLFTWFNMVSSAFLTGFDKAKESVIITLLKAVVFPLISVFVMTQIIDVNGVYITPTIAGGLTFIVAIFIWKRTTTEIKLLEEE